jgi:hypothetical protein
VYKNENILHFAQLVDKQTEGLGLQLMVADGGDSVEGEFLRQEWVLRRLALCQATVALHVLRKGGDFFCKIFDTFTPFLHDLLFLLSQAFEKMAIVKPLTSRPANSERYIICMGLRERRPPLAQYLLHVNTFLDDDDESVRARGNCHVRRIVRPESVPASWTNYVKRMNLRIGEAQAHALEETMRFYEDTILDISEQQGKLADELVHQWGIPRSLDKSKDMLDREWANRQPQAIDGSLMFVYNPNQDKPFVALAQQGRGTGPHAQASASAPTQSGPQASASGGGTKANGGGQPGAPNNPPPKKVGPDLSNASVLEALSKRAQAAQEKEESKQRELQDAKPPQAPSTAVGKLEGIKKSSKDAAKPKKAEGLGGKAGGGAGAKSLKEPKAPDSASKKRSREEVVVKIEDAGDGKRHSKKKKRDDVYIKSVGSL